MASIALGIYCAGMVLAFGYRTFAQRVRTGSSGWVGVSRHASTIERFGAVLFGLALLGGALSLWLTSKSMVSALVLPPDIALLGLILEVAGLIAVVVAQDSMGDSWRIGVDPNKTTALVTTGVFRLARNPIFAALVCAQIGVLFVAPNVVSLVAVAALVAAIQIQVRVAEEPYLLNVHPQYRDYATHVGRFLPRLGLLDLDDNPPSRPMRK